MSTIFQSLLRRRGFGNQVSRPATRRPQIRLCLEALDERLLPSISPFNSFTFDPSNMLYATPHIIPFPQHAGVLTCRGHRTTWALGDRKQARRSGRRALVGRGRQGQAAPAGPFLHSCKSDKR
jgi:hypothetical protein